MQYWLLKTEPEDWSWKDQLNSKQKIKITNITDKAIFGELVDSKLPGMLHYKEISYNENIENLKKLPSLEGRGTIERKLAIISELLTSASGKEAKYLIRTLIGDLRIEFLQAV